MEAGDRFTLFTFISGNGQCLPYRETLKNTVSTPLLVCLQHCPCLAALQETEVSVDCSRFISFSCSFIKHCLFHLPPALPPLDRVSLCSPKVHRDLPVSAFQVLDCNTTAGSNPFVFTGPATRSVHSCHRLSGGRM